MSQDSKANVVFLASLIESLFCAIEFATANVIFLQLSLYLFSGEFSVAFYS